MTAEQKTCQTCKSQFTIEADDLGFYEKLKVPPPTFCPHCRMVRRFMWRNERTLYRRPCDLCKRNIISIYSPASPYLAYCNECFYGDGWDSMSYGIEVDFSKPFFQQLHELKLQVPRLYSFVFKNVDSEYTNGAAFNKNCYLLFVSDYNEDSLYSYALMRSKNTLDCFNCTECELCYECVNCNKCYQVAFSEDCSDCQNVAFSKNCANCQDCVGCVNLRNKKYHIFNEAYSKEDYMEKLKTLKLDSREGIEAVQKKLEELSARYISKYIHGIQNKNVTGDYIFNSKSSEDCYDGTDIEDSKHLNHADHVKNCQDAYSIIENPQYCYELISTSGGNNNKFGVSIYTDFDATYSDTCENSNNIFGCIGLRKKQYCILNKEYSKEDYEALVAKITKNMDDMPYVDAQGKTYKYGEFFPDDLCPFAYNETAAQEYFPISKSEAEARGYRWVEPEKKDYKITLAAGALPSSIAEVQDSITQEVIGCAHEGKCKEDCTLAFRITPAELQIYHRLNLLIPALCPNCRHHRRLQRKNPPMLWGRNCQCTGESSQEGTYNNSAAHSHGTNICSNKFQTSYAPERQEIIYCEACYQAEVA